MPNPLVCMWPPPPSFGSALCRKVEPTIPGRSSMGYPGKPATGRFGSYPLAPPRKIIGTPLWYNGKKRSRGWRKAAGDHSRNAREGGEIAWPLSWGSRGIGGLGADEVAGTLGHRRSTP